MKCYLIILFLKSKEPNLVMPNTVFQIDYRFDLKNDFIKKAHSASIIP